MPSDRAEGMSHQPPVLGRERRLQLARRPVDLPLVLLLLPPLHGRLIVRDGRALHGRLDAALGRLEPRLEPVDGLGLGVNQWKLAVLGAR